MSESKKELSAQKQWIEENGSKYETLARGVDNYGHNISLTTDEFSEYQAITKDIADMFPDMISGYDDQNNAILKTKGNVEALTESYKKNVETAYASTLAKSNENFDDYKTATEDAIISRNTIHSMIGADKITGYIQDNKNLSFEAEGKQVIRNVISNLDASFYAQFESDSDMASYFYTNFIEPLKDGSDNSDLAIKINTLFSLNQNDYESYQDYIDAVNDIINQIKGYKDSEGNPLYSEEQINGLKNVLGVGKINKNGNLSGKTLIDRVKDKYLSIDGADEFIKTLSEKS